MYRENSPVPLQATDTARVAAAAFSATRPLRARKSGPLEYRADIAVDAALTQIVAHCRNHWGANHQAALAGLPAGIHQTRVSLRRLRAALATFSKHLSADERSWLAGEARRLAQALGPARDWDVFLSRVLAPVEAVRPGDADLAALRRYCEGERGRVIAAARTTFFDARADAFVAGLDEWLADRRKGKDAPGDTPLTKIAPRLLDKRHRKVRKAGRKLAEASVEDRHRLRIAVKKLRYAIEFLTPVYGRKTARPMLAAATRMQDVLGDLNDVAVTEARLAAIAEAVEGTRDAAAIRAAVTLVAAATREEAAGFERALPNAWAAFRAEPRFWREAEA